MFSHVLYSRFTDNVAPLADISLQTGSPADGYPVEWVADYNAERPSKLNETSGAWLFDHGAPVEVLLVAILHANFQEGLEVHVQRNATDTWGAPSIDETIITPAWRAGRMPAQPWIDLSAVAGAGAYRYTRIAVTDANAVPLSVGDIWMSTAIRSFVLQWSDKPSYGRPQVEHQTDYRKLRFRLGYTFRSWQGTIPSSDEVRDDIVDWIVDADGRPTLFIPEHAAVTPEAWMVIHTTTIQDVEEAFSNANFLPMAVEEDGRGLEPTPSPLP